MKVARVLIAYMALIFALGGLVHLLFPGSHGIVPVLVGLPVGVLGASRVAAVYLEAKLARRPHTIHEAQDLT